MTCGDADGAFEQPQVVLGGKGRGRFHRLGIDQHELVRRQPAGNPAARQCQTHFPCPDENDGTDIG
jgi:hypothetical protein